jgi:hypothetical protein
MTFRSYHFSFARLSAIAIFLWSSAAFAETPPEEAAANGNRLHKMLTGGIPLLPSNPLYSPVVSRLKENDYLGAAALITDPRTGAAA